MIGYAERSVVCIREDMTIDWIDAVTAIQTSVEMLQNVCYYQMDVAATYRRLYHQTCSGHFLKKPTIDLNLKDKHAECAHDSDANLA